MDIIEHRNGRVSTPSLQKTNPEYLAQPLTRFAAHLAKSYTPDPRVDEVHLLRETRERLAIFFGTQGNLPWANQIRTLEARMVAHRLRYHLERTIKVDGEKLIVPRDKPRKARFQRHHTDRQLLNVFLDHVNVQPHRKLGWLEMRELPLDLMCQETGFSPSTVSGSLARLVGEKLMSTKRRKNEAKDRERPATRWIKPLLFEILGLGKQYKKQKNWASEEAVTRRWQEAHDKTPPSPPQQPQGSVSGEMQQHGQASSKETAAAAVETMRRLLGKSKPPPDI